MIRIPCPFCGLRDHSEFTYLGDASVARPASEDISDFGVDGKWSEYLYQRANPRGRLDELWHHGHGCRSWLIVSRDTATHEVFGARLAKDAGRSE